MGVRAGSKQVIQDLSWCGPGSAQRRMGIDEAFEYCRKLAANHYENFAVTNIWIPSDIRPHFTSVYAYCRWSDDLADEMSDPAQATELLHWWKDELHKGFSGRSFHPVFVALHETQRNYSLPIEPFEDLLSAFMQDQSIHSYEDDLQVADYCSRSANPVGRIVLALARCASEHTIRWSDSVCTGLQLANFCQDVKLDAERNRFYLPRSRMLAAEIDASEWSRGSGRAKEALADWTKLARESLLGGMPLVSTGPSWFRRSMRLFIGGGLQILDNIQNAQWDVWNQSIEVSKFQKARLVAKACLGLPKQTSADALAAQPRSATPRSSRSRASNSLTPGQPGASS